LFGDAWVRGKVTQAGILLPNLFSFFKQTIKYELIDKREKTESVKNIKNGKIENVADLF
jgi:hypothetical protein